MFYGVIPIRKKFKNRYRVTTFRANWWDYGCDGAYFITINIEKRIHYFGEIENGIMKLSPAGRIAEEIWFKIPKNIDFAKLGAFVVMPNHIHGIIIINKKNRSKSVNEQHESNGIASNNTNLTEIKPKTGGATGRHNPMLQENVARLVRWYKGRTTYECRKQGYQIQWQSLYYDIIIPDERAYQNIERYIIRNPLNWREDRFMQ